MPYKAEKIRLVDLQDRRRKLTDSQKEEIKLIYAEGEMGCQRIAKLYGVSKRTIQIIVNPDARQRQHERIAQNWRKYRPTKEEWAATMREHRRYKHELYQK